MMVGGVLRAWGRSSADALGGLLAIAVVMAGLVPEPATAASRTLVEAQTPVQQLAQASPAAEPAPALDPTALAALKAGGVVLIMRHAATVPGTGDPEGFRLDDCSTQRNLSERGRADAARLGAALRAAGVRIERVLSSAWCRCKDTATAMGYTPEVFPAINSFFQDRGAEQGETEKARAAIASWKGPGVKLMVTHQVNISGLTQRFTAMGEGLVLAPAPDTAEGFRVVASLGRL